MIDPPLRRAPTEPPSGGTIIYTVGGEEVVRAGNALRDYGYSVQAVDAADLVARMKVQPPVLLVAEVVSLQVARAVLDTKSWVAANITELFLIADGEFDEDGSWSGPSQDESNLEDESPSEDEPLVQDEPVVQQDPSYEASDEPEKNLAQRLRGLATEVFYRPVDVEQLAECAKALSLHRRVNTAAPPSSSSLPMSEVPPTIGLMDVEEADRLLGMDGLPPAPLLSYPPPGQTSNPPGSSSSPPGVSAWPSAVPQPLGGTLGNGAFAGPTSVSEELERLLAEAEQRVLSEEHSASDVPSPEAEVDAILPPEVLAALDDPLEVADDGLGSEHTPVGGTGGVSAGSSVGGTAGGLSAVGTSTSTSGTSAGGTSAEGTVQRSRTSSSDTGESVLPAEPVTAHGDEQEEPTVPPPSPSRTITPVPQDDIVPNQTPPRPGASATMRNPQGSSGGAVFNVPVSWHRPDIQRRPEDGDATPVPSEGEYPPQLANERMTLPQQVVESQPVSPGPRTTMMGGQPYFATAEQVPTPRPGIDLEAPQDVGLQVPEVLTPEQDGLQVLGDCIAGRLSATLCFEYNGALCRAVMRDGDFVTCGSSADDESLLAFLMLRGDMPREVGMQMVGRIPPFGRHAAAALIANGFVGQDQLWVVLRAHAEWLLGRMACTQGGTCAVEAEPQGRLRAEPAVFGGATGAEVLVEVCQRVLPYEDAVARLGGNGVRLAPGPNEALVAECALSLDERALVERAQGRRLDEVLAEVGRAEFAAVLVALIELGVLSVMPSIGRPEFAGTSPGAPDPLDEEAVRKRVGARISTIQEGDYFEVIGVGRNATGYEIRRAYIEARRAFEPAHLLTAQTADLANDARLIIEVLDEAYELLRDTARRERYRRALEAVPPPER